METGNSHRHRHCHRREMPLLSATSDSGGPECGVRVPRAFGVMMAMNDDAFHMQYAYMYSCDATRTRRRSRSLRTWEGNPGGRSRIKRRPPAEPVSTSVRLLRQQRDGASEASQRSPCLGTTSSMSTYWSLPVDSNRTSSLARGVSTSDVRSSRLVKRELEHADSVHVIGLSNVEHRTNPERR